MLGTLRRLMIRIFRTSILPMSDHKSEAIVVVVFLLLVVGHRVQRLRQLDGLLQSGVQAVVRLVPKTSKGNPGCPRGLPLHVDKIRVERFDWVLLVSLVESYIPLVKAVFCRHGVVVYGTAHVVVGAVVVVVVADIERLHQLCVVILKCCCQHLHVRSFKLSYQRVGLPRKVWEHVLLGAGDLLPHLLVHTELRKVRNVGRNL